MAMNESKILLVEDDALSAMLIKKKLGTLSDLGVSIGQHAVCSLGGLSEQPSAVIIDSFRGYVDITGETEYFLVPRTVGGQSQIAGGEIAGVRPRPAFTRQSKNGGFHYESRH